MDNPFKKMSKPELYVVVGSGVAITGFLIYRHHSTTGSWNPWSSATASTAASGTAQSGTDPITGMPYSDDDATDPLTNQTYLAEANQYGSVAAAEASVGAFGQSTATGSGIPVNPASPASSGSVNTVVGTSVYTSNQAWAQAATAGLTDVGYDGPTVSQALGDYLTQTPLTPQQVQLVNTAIAEYGPAPVGDLQIIQAPIAKPKPPPVTKTAAVPKVEGESAGSATTHLQTDGFTVDSNGLPGNEEVKGTTPAEGTEHPRGTRVTLIGSGKKLPKVKAS